MPAARSRWFVRAVTVVLPLVPVTATHVLDSSDSRHASSTSLITSSLTAAAERYRSENSEMPGLAMHSSKCPPQDSARRSTAPSPNSTMAPQSRALRA